MTHAARVSERSAGRFSTSSFSRINAYAQTLRDEAPILAFRSFHPKVGILFFRSPQAADAPAEVVEPPENA